ncbi:MAG TPA: PilN domain-containing protein [Acidiferrobacterales bacterium]|nr:PilN domain-containing protein [Acidiferrobacterales bacterium]
MNQQINLYHPIFRRQEKKFSARAMLQASGLLLAGTVIMYAFAWWQVGALRSQITQAEQAQQAAVKQLEDISRTLGVKALDPRLEQDVRDLEARINASQQIEEVLQQDAFARSVGYSNYFAAFARQIVPGLWLTGVTITGAGEQLLLRGRSTTPELVPRYLQKLSVEKTLSGARFQVFQITRPEKVASTSTSYVEFVVKTGGAGEADAGDTQEAGQ